MNSRGGDAPPNGGEFLLHLLRKSSNSIPLNPSPSQSPSQALTQDPAVAALGPTISTFPPPHAAFPPNGLDLHHPPWHHSTSPPFPPHNYFQQNPSGNPNLNPDLASMPGVFGHALHQFNIQSNRVSLGDDARKLGVPNQQEQGLIFGSLNRDILQNQSLYGRNRTESSYLEEGLGMDRRLNGFPLHSIDINANAVGKSATIRVHDRERVSENGSYRAVAPPPGFSNNVKSVRNREVGYGRKVSDYDVDKGKGNFGDMYRNDRLSNQLDSPGLPAGSNLPSASTFDFEESLMEVHGGNGEKDEGLKADLRDKLSCDHVQTEIDDLEDQLVESLGLEDESGEKSDKKKHLRDKDYRSDKRGQWIMGQRMRNVKRHMLCRNDINRHNAPFVAVFESLIPADEEKVKQGQLLMSLRKIITKEWPEAQLHLYGSCANSFGFSKSDIDVCLAMKPSNIDKSEVLLKLADMFQSGNLQNVQALTRARVPVVKLMDPATGISCDICINNLLAVVNTKLLRDYAQIDQRLRQLAFIVKHWAKSRGVNETYHGTLSSYAYVIMCIHFLQMRTPPILPCLQRMEVTYSAKLDDVDCAFFDKVEMLQNFGSRNRESIAQLVWGFFHYWAYCHDYANDVISVRTGSTLSKRAKDWTRRVGNDRHLICIEDPFELSHDLGRVVDKFSIRVLREEFERAADIMHHDPNPSITLFQPYLPD